MLYTKLACSLVILEGTLILLCLILLIRIKSISKNLGSIFQAAYNDKISFSKQLKDLTIMISKNEDTTLKMIFCLNDIERIVTKTLVHIEKQKANDL